MIADGHADLLWYLSKIKYIDKRIKQMSETVLAWETANLRLQVLPIFVEPNGTVDEQWFAVQEQMQIAHDFISHDERFMLITNDHTYLEWKNCLDQDEKRIGIVLALEGCDALEDHTRERLAWLYENGLRMIALTWNPANEFADGCHDRHHGGISAKGITLIEQIEELGMILDTAHLSEEAFWAVCDATQMPLINSHSNSRTVFEHPRNLTDKQIIEIIQRDGVIGLNVIPFLLGVSDDVAPEQSFQAWYRHLDHMLRLGAEKQVGFGSDLWGADRMISALANPEMWLEWTERLKNENTLKSERFVKVCSENWLRFFERVFGRSELTLKHDRSKN